MQVGVQKGDGPRVLIEAELIASCDEAVVIGQDERMDVGICDKRRPLRR